MHFAGSLAAAAAALFFGVAANAQDSPSSTTAGAQLLARNSTFALRMKKPGDNRFDNKYLSSTPLQNSTADMAVISNTADYKFRFELSPDAGGFDPVQGGSGTLFYESPSFADGPHNLTAGFILMESFNSLGKRQASNAIPNMLPMVFNVPDEKYTWTTTLMPDGEMMLAGTSDSIACTGLSGVQGASWFKGSSLVGIFNAIEAQDNGIPPMGAKCATVEFFVQLPPQ